VEIALRVQVIPDLQTLEAVEPEEITTAVLVVTVVLVLL
jgi:hypothetical protein